MCYYFLDYGRKNRNNMKIKKKSFGGIVGFELRKAIPKIGSKIYLTSKRKIADSSNKKYIKKVSLQEKLYPIVVNIETINKCNGTCPFCCCNKNEDLRPFKIMSDELFEK